MKDKIDYEVVFSLLKEMSDRAQLISKFIPEEQGSLLKNLAAASIHLAFFARDLASKSEDITIPIELEKEFLENCGCKGNE